MSINWVNYPEHIPEIGRKLLVHDGVSVFTSRYIWNSSTPLFQDVMGHECLKVISYVKQWAYYPEVPKTYKLDKLLRS